MKMNAVINNLFYSFLRDKYKEKYELAASKCWTICLPCNDALKGIVITSDFVDNHILRPHSRKPLLHASTDELDSRLYKFEDMAIELVHCQQERLSKSNDSVKVLSVETGYNEKFLKYTLLILDRPLPVNYEILELVQNAIQLDREITCYKEALEFLNELQKQEKCHLEELKLILRELDVNQFQSAEDLNRKLQKLTRIHWTSTMRKCSFDLQRDVRFQKLLSTSLEVFIMHFMHDKIYTVLSNALKQEDSYVNTKINQLIDASITPDQLGVKESFAIPLPAAIVELATLDGREGPIEKQLCLKNTLDLIVAEMKGALADIETKVDINTTSHLSSRNDLLKPLLLYVIVKSRPKRLVTDLHYIRNFLWSISPHDGLCHTIVTFKSAISSLYKIDVENLPPRSDKVKTELPISELLDVMRGSENGVTPLDREIHQLATRLEKCIQNKESLI